MFSSRRWLHPPTRLFPQSHHVLPLLGLVYSTYLNHVILVDVRFVIENDDENIFGVVVSKQIEPFSPMEPVLSLWS